MSLLNLETRDLNKLIVNNLSIEETAVLLVVGIAGLVHDLLHVLVDTQLELKDWRVAVMQLTQTRRLLQLQPEVLSVSKLSKLPVRHHVNEFETDDLGEEDGHAVDVPAEKEHALEKRLRLFEARHLFI